jgi:hypothetical protein
VFESVERPTSKHPLKVLARESSCAIVDTETRRPAFGHTHLGLDLSLWAFQAVGVRDVPVARDHAVERNVIEAAYAFAYLTVGLRISEVLRLGLLGLFNFSPFCHIAFNLLLCADKFFWELAASFDKDKFGPPVDSRFANL